MNTSSPLPSALLTARKESIPTPLFECPAFDDIRRSFQQFFDDSHGAMRLLMWHPCQKDVASCLLQLLDRIDETLT